MPKFFRNSDGLATMEWVMLCAVLILAAVGIASFVMQGADGTAGTVKTGLGSLKADVEAAGN